MSVSKKSPDRHHISRISNDICRKHSFAINAGGALYVYKEGVYRPGGAEAIREEVKRTLKSAGSIVWTSHLASEVVRYIEIGCSKLAEVPPTDRLNLANGILYLATRRLVKHQPSLLTQVQLPVQYDREARCPAWEKFISEVFPEDAQQLPWEIVAWLMLPNTDIQKALLLLGEGANGKSTFLRALRAFLGPENTRSFSLQALEEKPFAPAYLFGKLANICPDIPSKKLESTAMFKAIVGGDQIMGEYKYGDHFQFVSPARLIFSANRMPLAEDPSHGFHRRWFIVLFTHQFEEDPQKARELDKQLANPAELSGVLNKALCVLPKVLDTGLTISPSIQNAIDAHQAENDPLSSWLKENLVEDLNGFLPRAAVRDRCKSDGIQVNPVALGRTIKRLFRGIGDRQHTIDGNVRWGYTGIAWRN